MATLRPAGQPAPANPVAANPPQTNASETGVNNAIRAAQSDFRLYEDASKALQTLVANQPAARARADFEQQVRSLAELRRAALAERGTVDPAKDKFGAAHITDEGAAYIAQCLRDIDGLASVAIGSKGVDIQPAIPAWIVTAVAPDLPKGKSSAKDQLTEQLHNCIAPLHQAGTAAVLVDADANHPLVRRISQTSGAIMWTPAR